MNRREEHLITALQNIQEIAEASSGRAAKFYGMLARDALEHQRMEDPADQNDWSELSEFRARVARERESEMWRRREKRRIWSLNLVDGWWILPVASLGLIFWYFIFKVIF